MNTPKTKPNRKIGELTIKYRPKTEVTVTLIADLGAYQRVDLATPDTATDAVRKEFPRIVETGRIMWRSAQAA